MKGWILWLLVKGRAAGKAVEGKIHGEVLRRSAEVRRKYLGISEGPGVGTAGDPVDAFRQVP